MYSLYRAWLSLGPGFSTSLQNMPPMSSQSPLNLSSPAHIPGTPDVTLHVGPSMTQFSAHKAVLSAHSGYFKAALINQTDTSPISVPNVNVDEFSSLLTFMYTGYLDLNIRNIYNILLATHILHMPSALEICRSFLMHSQTIESRTNVIKPVASRKMALPPQQIYAPNYSNNLQKSEHTVFKEVHQPETNLPELNRASTSKIEKPPSIATVLQEETKTEKKVGAIPDKAKQKRRAEPNEKVIIDIACCDGPVRFHRVVNKNYGFHGSENVYEIQQVNRNAAMNKAMSENIKQMSSDENNQGVVPNAASTTTNADLFTCLYCNHTFKSQYCYQKHARRHLNPVNVDTKLAGDTKEQQQTQHQVKREVKLLDMNVQYYPCKTCGSKFPSYYFVHKHRKLCHAEEMADNNNKNNEIVPEIGDNTVTSTHSDQTSVNSPIDVEAIHSDQNEAS